MILIKKNTEPHAWMKYRNTPGVDYQSIEELVKALKEEQGYICAYCMRRIPVRDKIYSKDGKTYQLTSEEHRIEHIKSRENHPDLKLNYGNMVICCPGHIGNEDHCDRLKSSNDISFSPLDAAFIETLTYNSDGEILSSNPRYNQEINEVLNLNTPLLKENRRQSWEAVKTQLVAKKGGIALNKSLIEHYIARYSTMRNIDGKPQYTPYCGILIYYLRKRLKQFN